MPYSGVYVFGDSLADAGNALKLAQWYDGLPFTDLPEGAPTADQGYFMGRFSNGYVFTDLISNKALGTVSKPVFPYGFDDPWLGVPLDPLASDPTGSNLNFAYGGAQIRNGEEVVPDLDGQTDAFKDAVDNRADPNALYVFTLGGNDVRSLAPVGSPPASLAEAQAALDLCADQLLHELGQLIDIGARNFVITGIPDVGLIPKYDLNDNGTLDSAELERSAAATSYSEYLDGLIRTEVVPALRAMGANVTYVPLMDYVDADGTAVTGALSAILPELAALHGLPANELSDNLLQHQGLVFFDDIHPNAQVEALVTGYMQSLIAGAPWVETLPLTGSDIDYRLSARIGAAGETDKVTFSLVAGTTYRFDMLGVGSIGTAGYVADTALRLLGGGGALLGSDDDSGAGLDATLTFTAATDGTYVLELNAIGGLTGLYALRTAAVSGAAMAVGNTYTVTDPAVMVIEGRGGLGTDVVMAGVSYVLGAGSEVEVLRTTNDKGKTAISLTGNEFGQTLIGNAGANVLEGKSGADVMSGGAGSDTFVLSATALTRLRDADTITDYGRGDVVDVTQVLSVAAGTDVSAGGYLRVTSGGLIQADIDGGGDHWVTLSTINGSGSVTLRYLSGGAATNVTLSRVADGSAATAIHDEQSVMDHFIGPYQPHEALFV